MSARASLDDTGNVVLTPAPSAMGAQREFWRDPAGQLRTLLPIPRWVPETPGSQRRIPNPLPKRMFELGWRPSPIGRLGNPRV